VSRTLFQTLKSEGLEEVLINLKIQLHGHHRV